ncbi:hypothetical protein ILYODFUR_037481 [Ilyodon furcidens]|uniref:Uncharacterized protein n=1 Tax=Ilyodon furcidens TaxID=33524 RepID=A0ABV0SUZ3_9TELE
MQAQHCSTGTSQRPDLGMQYQVVQGMKFLMVIATGPGTLMTRPGPGTAMAPPGPDTAMMPPGPGPGTAMAPPGPGTGQWKVGTPIASGCVPEKGVKLADGTSRSA